jgi:hypothetical protein
MYNAIIDQVFLDQSYSMLSIFEYRFCMTDSSPVMADIKRGASVHLVRMHKLKKSTVNLSCGKSCSGSISIGNRVHLMFLRACYFGFRCSIKSLQWKLIIFTHILQLFCFVFVLFHSLCTSNRNWVVAFPTGRDSATFRDKGTEVPSLYWDKGTTEQAQNLATGRDGIFCRLSHPVPGRQAKTLKFIFRPMNLNNISIFASHCEFWKSSRFSYDLYISYF